MATLSRDNLCNIGSIQIPRPGVNGFQFVPTRGRMGFYRSIKRDGHKYGLDVPSRGPRRPQLADVGFWTPPSLDQTIHETNNNIEKQHTYSPSEQSYSDLSSDSSGSTKFPIAPLKKTPPPAPPLPADAAGRLPPRPPRVVPTPKKHVTMKTENSEFAEPPIDYEVNEEVRQVFRRQVPVASKPYRQTPSEYEVNIQNRKNSISSSRSSGSKYSERF